MNLYDATVPVFTKLLGQVDRWLDKAIAHAEQRKFDPEVLIQSRLAPNQYSFVRQIQAACDQAKFTVAKLAGKDAPVHADNEKSIGDVRARLKLVIDFMATVTREDFNGAEERACSHTWMQGRAMRGGDYLDHMALPNLHFHLTTAYAILRHNGVDLGKADYIGDLPFIPR